MLVRLSSFVFSNVRNLVVVKPLRIARSFFGNDPQHIWQIVQGVDHLLDIGILKAGDVVGRRHGHGRYTFGTTGVVVVDAIDVVRAGKRVAIAGAAKYVDELAGKEIDTRIDSGVVQGLCSGP